MILALLLVCLAKYTFTRRLLLRFPTLFSIGMVSCDGPSDEIMQNTRFSFTFYGKGWPKEEKLAEPSDRHNTKPTRELITKVSGANPAYGATATAALLSAVTVLTETDMLPRGGGVLNPGICFAKTNLISNLCKHGINFEVISGPEGNTSAN